MQNTSLIDIKKQEEKQYELFQKQLVYVYNHSPYYRKIMEKNDITLASIQSLQDLSVFPVTEKEDLQLYWKEMIACKPTEIADYSTTSGTSGSPVTVPISQADLERLAYNESLSLQRMDVTSDDVIQLCTATDRSFMAGLAYMLGARKLGVPLIRAGAGMPEMQWERMLTLGVTVLIAVPSFVIRMLEYATANQLDISSLKLQKILCIGEAIRNDDFSLNALGQRINQKLPSVSLYSTYASTEMQTAFTECKAGNGGHHIPNLMITEFLDENNEPVSANKIGELTITHLGVSGMPLIRFKTGDVCMHYIEKCKCGEETLRIGPILGRKQQMIKFKGTTLFPSAIQDVVDTYDEIADALTVLNSDEFGNDLVSVYIELKEENATFEKKIKDSFKSRLRVTPEIIMTHKVIIETIRSSVPSRKLIKLVDLRTKNEIKS